MKTIFRQVIEAGKKNKKEKAIKFRKAVDFRKKSKPASTKKQERHEGPKIKTIKTRKAG